MRTRMETERASTLALLGGERAVSIEVRGEARPTPGEVRATLRLLAARPDHELAPISSQAGGGLVGELEEAFRSMLGVRYVLGISSGTAALHAALAACGVGSGDEVVVSAYDWGAATAAVLGLGADPVFADIDHETYTLDPASVADRVTPHTVAIVVTHIFGHPSDMDSLCALARARGLRVVEDCAQALGARYQNRPVGTLGDAGCFSLGPSKAVSAGEGGILVTSSDEVFDTALRFSQHPLRQAREGVEPNHFALNLRIHPLAAALALQQLSDVEDRIVARRRVGEQMTVSLEDLPGVRPVRVADGCTHSFQRYSPTLIPGEWDGLSREAVVEALAAEGVPVAEGPVGVPVPRRLAEASGHRPVQWKECPIAERRCDVEEIALGLHEQMEESSRWLEQVDDAFAKVYRWRHLLLPHPPGEG